MGGVRFGRVRLVVREQGPGRIAVKKLWGRVGLLAVLLVGVLALVPAGASAEPLCTDTWTGPAEGNWTTAADWSAGVPTSASVACIGVGKVVTVSEGSNPVGVLEDKGSLALAGGTLEITSALETSSVSALAQASGILSGAGTLDVSSSLVTFSGATMAGLGSTVVLPGASATLESGLSSDRTFLNEGTTKLITGSLSGGEGTKVENKGTFIAGAGASVTGPTASFINSGTFKRAEGEGTTTVNAKFEIKGR
jgi:hypothetical protein